MSNPIVTVETMAAEVMPILVTVARKNADYGDSVFSHGLMGIFIRLFDKIMRMQTLVWFNREAQIKEESVADIFRDFIGYCVLGLLHMAWEREKAAAANGDVTAAAPPAMPSLRLDNSIGTNVPAPGAVAPSGPLEQFTNLPPLSDEAGKAAVGFAVPEIGSKDWRQS